MNAHERALTLQQIFRTYFPEAADDSRTRLIDRLLSINNLAKSFQTMENSVRPDHMDVSALLKVEKLLRSASDEMKKVGWYGSVPLYDSLNEDSQALTSSKLSAPAIVAEQIAAIADLAATAAKEAPNHGETIYDDILTGAANPARINKPKQLHATQVAFKCAEIFHTLDGRNPSVNTRSGGAVDAGQAYGPFLNFVSGVFNALGISASAESRARDAASQWRKGRKKDD